LKCGGDRTKEFDFVDDDGGPHVSTMLVLNVFGDLFQSVKECVSLLVVTAVEVAA
jgi:hypothetical protein